MSRNRWQLLSGIVILAAIALHPPRVLAQHFPQLPENYDLPGGPPAAPSDDPLGPPPACPLDPGAIQITTSLDPEFGGSAPENYAVLTREGEKLSCLQTIIDDVYAACLDCVDCYQEAIYGSTCHHAGRRTYRNNCVPGTDLFDRLIDDCFFSGFLQAIGERGGEEQLDEIYYSNNFNPFWLLDSSCNPLAADDPRAISACTGMHITWYDSPISLLWEKAEDFGKELAFTTFPLRLGAEHAWYTWKASGAAPLLVNDPAHEGRITSPTQLFGNWTFGGQKLARNADPEAPRPWRNGFEALATFDTDHNGAVDGQELEPLALWFDYNRDGISNAGEVQRLGPLAVTKLFYQPEREDKITGDIYAGRGFERTINGVPQIGAAVDWFAHGAPSKSSLILRHSLDAMAAPAAPSIPAEPAASETQIEAHALHSWRWEVDSDQTGERATISAGGTLLLKEFEDGSVQGLSLFELPIAPGLKSSGKQVRSIFKQTRQHGTVKDSGDTRVFKFTSEENGTKTVTSAQLLKNGEIHGESELTAQNAERPTTLRYKWHGRVIDLSAK